MFHFCPNIPLKPTHWTFNPLGFALTLILWREFCFITYTDVKALPYVEITIRENYKTKSPLTCYDPLGLIRFHVAVVLTGNRSEIWFCPVVQASIEWVRIICVTCQWSRWNHLKDKIHSDEEKWVLLQNINLTSMQSKVAACFFLLDVI